MTYYALVLSGGVVSPDHLRLNHDAVGFVHDFVAAGKPVAAICHAPWLLIEAGVVRGRAVTSWPSLRTDLLNAGAIWVDQEVCVDGALITSRRPPDLPPAFHRQHLILDHTPADAGRGVLVSPGDVCRGGIDSHS